MALPNFLIIGAQKAGTTTLYDLLRRHPDIHMSPMKEPGYFIRAFPDPVRFQELRRPDGRRSATPIGLDGGGCYTREDYEALFQAGEAAAVRGEASTPYLPSPYAAGRIAEVLPDVRLAVLLRDPVERAFSAYNYNRSRGMEPAGSFEEAVASELRGERDDWVYGWRYLYTGRYAEHLRRYLARFPRERLLVLRFEDLRADPGEMLAVACRFLGVAPIDAPPQPIVANPTVVHTSPLLRAAKSAVTASGPMKRVVRAVIPRSRRGRLGKALVRSLDRFGSRPSPISEALDADLRAHFREPNQQLAELVGIDVSAWNRVRRPG